MNLIEWDDPLTGAKGLSGTRYGLVPMQADSSEAGESWLVTADDQRICVADSASAAVSHIEHLEALRCFARGLAGRMTPNQLAQAKAIAVEMAEAAGASLADGSLSPDEATEVERSLRDLLSLKMMIGIEQERRDTVTVQPMQRVH